MMLAIAEQAILAMAIDKILMVDDDATIRRVAQISLSRVGKFNVALAESGKQALAMVGEFKPDVILLDVMMPGMDGPTTYKLLRENEEIANTPVIFMTAKVQTQEVEGYCKLGAAGVITKPFNLMTLPAEIRQILATEA